MLFEHAAGYAVFKVKEYEEIGAFLPQLEAAVYDISKFNSIVQLESFSPFKTAVAALENINAISEGIVPEHLRHFLDITLPSKRKKVKLGVCDPKLGAAITEALDIECDHTGAVPDLLRGKFNHVWCCCEILNLWFVGVRFHHRHLINGFTDKTSGQAQLGLGHAYSRGKVKFNVHRVDNMIIQSIAILDNVDKNVNTITMRLRWVYVMIFEKYALKIYTQYNYPKLYRFRITL